MLVVVALLAVGIGIAARATRVTRSLEWKTIDARFEVRGRVSSPANMVLVSIDANTFNYYRDARLHSQFPFPRRYYARVIDNLRHAGARVIAIDIQFTEPTDDADDLALYNAIGRARNVVLATTEVKGNGQTAILGGNANLRAVHALPGDTTFRPDGDGVTRRTSYSIQGLKTFAVAIAEADGHPVPAGAFGSRTVPIDYAYPAGGLPTISMSDVWRGRFDAAWFRGKIVFVGATAPSLQDVHATPTDGVMPGVELQANATNTILHHLPLRDGASALAVVFIIVLGLAQPLLSIRLSRPRWVAISLVVGASFLVVAQLLFDGGTIIDVTDPLIALACGTFGSLAVLYLAETVERERVRSLFARFVPGSVVDQVLAGADENLRLGAVERDCTVLFSDLRGFTAFSEGKPPQRVLDVVNVYLEEMTNAILAAGGTLIAYMGDGIMALFGAPLEQPDHADRALAAAREMLGPRLDRFNGWITSAGHASGFRMGIGLHSGPVMAGNVGSEDRLDYTAIGDTTNTASRLEGLTKGSGYMLLLSSATRERLTGSPEDLVFVHDFEVRGRAEKIAAWSIPTARTPA